MSGPVINIGSKLDGKGFKQADTAMSKLAKTGKNLGKTLGLALSTAAVLAYGKASVKAAADDQRAQQQLALALKNVGLGRDAAVSEAYIQRLQSEFGIVDDLLRPAYQTLAVATRDTAEAQKLFNLSLDLSASTGFDLATTSNALSKAFLGNNTALLKLRTGISKADLKTKSFDDITKELAKTFKGAALTNANSLTGGLDKLTVAASNAKEIIGTGLVQAFTDLGGSGGLPKTIGYIEGLANKISDVIVYISHLLRNVAILADSDNNLIEAIREINRLSKIDEAAYLRKYSQLQLATDNAHLSSLTSAYKVTGKIIDKTKKLTAEELKKLAASKLQLATEKAKLALGKGEDVFNMDAIQNNAALLNQAEQLGKVTNAAQVLAIANDVARLNVKKSMLELEAAIASGDVKAIETATAKLNADLKILGALTGQAVKLQDIKSILDSLKSKDLINLDNLDAAIAKMLELIRLQNLPKSVTTTAAVIAAGAGITFNPNQNKDRNYDMNVLGIGTTAIPSAAANISVPTAGVNYNPNQNADRNYDIKVYANTIASPDELTNLIQDAVIRLNKRGDYITTAGAL